MRRVRTGHPWPCPRVSLVTMSKFLLLILLVVVIYLYFVRAKRRPLDDTPAAPPAIAAMMRCARCGLHVPAEESIVENAKAYCCEEHRRLDNG